MIKYVSLNAGRPKYVGALRGQEYQLTGYCEIDVGAGTASTSL